MLTCQYCGVTSRKDGRPFEKQGQLNLHEYHCKMKNHSSNNDDLEECKHSFRFLNLRQPIERKAYSAGYIEVCSKCQEVR